jgi:nucleoside-triphosphatase
VGKTSIIFKIVNSIKGAGYGVGGMVSREVNERGIRVGFELEDLKTGRKGWLAHKEICQGPRLGKYFVNMRDLNTIGVGAIQNSLMSTEINLMVIDEIGPMELFSDNFVNAVRKAINSDKLLLGSIHRKSRHSLLDEIRALNKANIITINFENRDYIHNDISSKIINLL